jgi:uncharacterized protein (DUF952 family)
LRLTYHATPKAHFDSLDPNGPYLPPDYDADDFVHCTDGAEALSVVLTTYYKDEPGDWVVLYLDAQRITSPVRYDDPAKLYPHVYGPINRDAIIAVKEIDRAADGKFLRPQPL